MLGEEQGAAFLTWLAGRVATVVAETTSRSMKVANYTQSAGDHATRACARHNALMFVAINRALRLVLGTSLLEVPAFGLALIGGVVGGIILGAVTLANAVALAATGATGDEVLAR